MQVRDLHGESVLRGAGGFQGECRRKRERHPAEINDGEREKFVRKKGRDDGG